MRDAIAMWRNTKMVVLVALSAALYAAILIPFKPIPIIPGITEIRPAAAIPIVTGLLFGPAAAWGCAMGNLIGDFFGTVGPGSLFGLLGNFLLAYVPYRLWHLLSPRRLATGAVGQLPVFALVTIAGSAACAVVIAYGIDLLGLAPYEIVATIITINNCLVGIVLGMPLLALLYPRARRWGLTYPQIMADEDVGNGLLSPLAGLMVVAAGAVGASAALDKAGVFVRVGAGLAGLVTRHAAAFQEAWGTTLLVPEEMALRQVGLICSLALCGGVVLLARLPRRYRPAEAPTMTEPRPVLGGVDVEGLSFTYPEQATAALDDINFSQRPGELCYLMGRTGAGKSTLCLCLNGVIPRLQQGTYRGRVQAAGLEVASLPVAATAQHVGVVFQDFESQLFCSDVEREIAFGLENHGVPSRQMHQAVARWLNVAGLSDLRLRDPTTLSGGEKQRLALAAVMAAEPQIAVLDEPTTDLDPQGAAAVTSAFQRLHHQGRTLLIVDHSSPRAMDADKLLVLDSGRLAYAGRPEEILAQPAPAERWGLQCLPTAQICAQLGLEARPVTVAQAADELHAVGVKLDGQKWGALQHKEAQRTSEYGEVVVEVEDLHFAYDGVPALNGVSLQVRCGEFLIILGSNGSGKTTLCKHLNGLLKPRAGQVLIAGRSTAQQDTAELAATVGYLFQNPDHQLFADTVYAEVAFGPRNLGIYGEGLEYRVRHALELTELTGYEQADPFALTKGERQRVALASVLALLPRVIVFDEPTTGLDIPQQQAMFDLLGRLNSEGQTIIMVTHHAEGAIAYAHRAVLMADGEIVADGPVREIFSDANLCAQAHQSVPASVQLSQQVLGVTLLSPAEFAECVRVTEEGRGEGQ